VSVRHYVIFSTDGFIKVPTTSDILYNSKNTKDIYIFGFVGGLFRVDNDIIDPSLNWQNPLNWNKYVNMKGTATIPSPIICGKVDDDIFITLINLGMKYRSDLTELHTIHIQGANLPAEIDGFPETSFGIPTWTNYKDSPPVATYYFKPERSGTYVYYNQATASQHVQMGMYGAVVIYPSLKNLEDSGVHKSRSDKWYFERQLISHIPSNATNHNFAYANSYTYFDKEYIILLSNIDSNWHNNVLNSKFYNSINYKPDYWLINGRAFPHTLYPHPQTKKDKKQPNTDQINYESYVHIKYGQKVLLRIINMGYQVVPWHVHGWSFSVAGKDAELNQFLKLSAILNLEKHGNHVQEMGCTASLSSGETYDIIISADDKTESYENYISKGLSTIPYLRSQLKDLLDKNQNSIATIPLEPLKHPNTDFVNFLQLCGQTNPTHDKNNFPHFYTMHNNDSYTMTNNGIYPGGQLTFIQVDN
jgi:hypothetical protein